MMQKNRIKAGLSALGKFPVRLIVQRRTKHLSHANEQLRAQVEERKRAEEALRQERDFISAVLDTAGTLVVVLDSEGRITRFNRACEEITGYSAAEVLGRIVWDFLVPAEELPGVKEACNRLVSGNFPNAHENHWLTRRGDRRLISWSNTALFDTTGKAEHIIATGVDITERRRIEEELRATEQRMRFQLVETPAVLYSAKPDVPPRATFVSDNVRTLLGFEPAEIIGDPEFWLRQVHPDDAAGVKASLATVLRQGSNVWEYRLRDKAGTCHWVRDHLRLVRDSSGAPLELVGCLIDVTPYKQAEEALRRSEELHRVFFELGAVGMAYVSPDGHLLKVNDAFCEITGYSPAELATITVFDLTHPEDRESDQESFALFTRGERPVYSSEKRYVRKDGSLRWIAVTARMIHGPDGQPLHTIGIIKDITARKRAEAALLASEQKYRSFYESILDGFVSVDMQGRIQEANQGFLDMLGYSAAEIRQLKYQDITPARWHEIEARIVAEQILPRGHSEVYDKEYVRKDGTVFPVELRTYLIRDNAGSPAGMWAFVRDITSRKRAEEAMRDSEARFRTAFEDGPVAMSLTSVDCRLLKVNAAFCRMLGFSETELVGRSFAEITHPDDRTPNLTGFRRVASGEIPSFRMEKRYIRKDGFVVWTDMNTASVRNAQGVPLYVVTHIQDITERKRADEALRESERRLAGAERIAHLGSWELDLVRDRLTWSDEVYRIFGLEPREFAATYEAFLDRVHPEDRAAVDAAYSGSLRDNTSNYEIEHRVVRKNTGEIRWVEEKCQHVRDAAGKIVRSLGMVLDITERKLSEELLQSQAKHLEKLVQERTARLEETVGELEYFSYTITHDMRAPLRAMSGYGKMLLEDNPNLSPDSKQFIERINSATRRMDRLILDALDYSKLVRQEFDLKPVDGGALLRGMIESYPQYRDPRARIIIEQKLPVVLGNEALMTQCFSNLLNNAIKFVQPGQIPEVRIQPEEKGDRVRIWFQDNGIGIPKELQERIFLMFQRVNHGYEGTGIGLALVRKAAERMGGTTGVESEPGKGSRFWLEFNKAALNNGPAH